MTTWRNEDSSSCHCGGSLVYDICEQGRRLLAVAQERTEASPGPSHWKDKAVSLLTLFLAMMATAGARSESPTMLPVHLTWGHRSASGDPFVLKPSGHELTISG